MSQNIHLIVADDHTVRLHVYQKLDLHDRAALIDYAVRHGLLRP